jgi:D-glycero-D-manno-heptose 1,7-bisphosphate phosphatase
MDRARRPGVFLDRDGVLTKSLERDGKPFPPTSAGAMEIYPDARPALDRLKEAGYALAVVTNQPDVGRGTMDRTVVEEMHVRLQAELPVDCIEVCYDDGVKVDSDRRKPKPGMLLAAARSLNIDLPSSYMVGDRWRDIDAGVAAGCKTIFIDRGWKESLRSKPDFVCAGIVEAAEIVLRGGGKQ